MEPEVDFETWSLIITTTTNDIDGFSAMLPGLKRLMKSIEKTNYLPDNLALYTDNFVEEIFPTTFNKILSDTSSKAEKDDILSVFFRSTIELCASKINNDSIEKASNEKESIENYKKQLINSINLINIISKIFDKIDLNQSANEKEKILDRSLILYFLNDLQGMEKCISSIDNIDNLIDYNYTNNDTNDNDSKNKSNNNIADEIQEKQSLKLSYIFKLAQKVIFSTTIKESSASNDSDKIRIEKEKFEKYNNQMHSLIDKIFPVFQKIINKNIRKFDVSHLDPIFKAIMTSYQVDILISSEDEFPLSFNFLDPSCLEMLSIFLKSEFFDKHLYAIKSFSQFCSKVSENINGNKKYFDSDEEKRKKEKLHVNFIDKNILLNAVISNLELIQNLHFNKEYGEALGNIYSFLIENKEGVITLDYIKNLWSSIQFIHSADRSSFYKIFEKVAHSLNEKDNDEFIDFVLLHISTDFSELSTTEKDSTIFPINKQILEFLISIIADYKKANYKNSFIKIRDLIWSLSFNENESKEASELKEISRRRINYICDYCSNEIVEKLVNEKFPLISQMENNDEKECEKEFILKLCSNSITKQEEINNDICSKIISFCIDKLPDKLAINILTNVCTTQKVSLEKEQIEQLSNISNKFLSNILLSSGFDDNYIENFFLTTKNIDYDLYDLIEKYILQKNQDWNSIENDYLTHLPFEKEDLLWNFALKKSNVRQKFVIKLCEIYSNNDGVLLTDKQMIISFLNKVNYFINDFENRESCFQLLQRFIGIVDETNPNLIDIKKHEQSNDKITVNLVGIEGKFTFSKENASVVVFYQVSKSMNIPINQISLSYNNSAIQMNKKLSSIAYTKNSIDMIPIISNSSTTSKIKHLRTVSPSLLICHSILMDKLISFLIEDIKNDSNSYVLMTLLSDLPTSEPINNMINYFYLMKEIDFKRLFPINHPRFFLYCLNVLQKMDDSFKVEIIRTKGIEYLIYSLTRVDNLMLIIEIIDYLKNVLTTDELIEKYSDQLLESLMRLASCLDASYQESCLTFMKKLKPKNIPPFDPQFAIQFVEPVKKEEKEEKEEKEIELGKQASYTSITSSELSLYQESSDFITLSSFISYESMENVGIKSQDSLLMKKEKSIQCDNEIPLSHIIAIVIAMTLIQKNVFINSSIEPKTGHPSAFLKKTAKETFQSLPIPSEYFEASFPYVNSSNYKEFYSAFSPHAKPPTDTAIQFIIDNLDIKSKHLPFIMKVLNLIIDEIKDEEKRTIIFNFIFDNFFILDKDGSIENDVFENAMEIASNAPSEMIINRIKEIGIPEFDKYRVTGDDFKPDKNTTGLKNLGCTCYFNSLLQQFFHCPLLRKTLIEYKGDDELIKQLGILFSKMRDGSLKFVSPINVIENWVCWDGEKIKLRVQQDASEYVEMMIEKLAAVIPNSMFGGQFLQKVEELSKEENKYYTERIERFSVLALPLNQSKTLEECLTAFNSPTFFTNKNQYYADTLKRKIDAKGKEFIEELPDHLIIQLKRFEYDVSIGNLKKIDTPISISKEIDVASICEFKQKDEKRSTKYNLCGVIMHSGTPTGGHYYSFVMQRETNNWYKFNDSEVTPITIDDVLTYSKGYSANAYLLFYDRSDLVEIDDSKIDQSFAIQLQEENKMNAYYYFYMTNGFTKFLNKISERPELQKLSTELVIKVLSHANVETSPNYFEKLKERLMNDADFANSIQDEITDFKFTILNDFPSTSKLITEQVLVPIFNHSSSPRLIELAIDTFDFLIEKLPDSSCFFRVLYSILNGANKEKSELAKDEEKNKELIGKLNGYLNTISEKTVSLLTNGIKEYSSKQQNLNYNYVINSINLSVIVRLFTLFDSLPNDFVEMLKDNEFLKNLYSSKCSRVDFFIPNYIHARELNLFDVNSMFKSFFEKESIHLNMGPLFKSVFLIFKEEAFPMIWTLKFKFENNYRSPQDVALCLALLCKNKFDNEFFKSHFNGWVPSIVLHESKETRAMANVPIRYLIPHKIFKKVFGDIKAISGSIKYTSDFFNSVELADEVTPEMKRDTFELIQCLFGCFDKMKELIEKDDFSKSLSFSEENYRAIQFLKIIKASIKIFNSKTDVDHEKEFSPLDFSPLIDFGKFLLSTGHSHPFDPHIILILEILKSNVSDELLMDSIPCEEVMNSPEKLEKIPSEQFEKYMKVLSKIFDKKLEKELPFNVEFLNKLYKLIIFNLRNLNTIVKTQKPIESLNAIIESICNKNNKIFNTFIEYLDKNLENCIAEGLFSCVTGLMKLEMKRPIAPYIVLYKFNTIFENLEIIYPSLYSEIIKINNNEDETLFNDISDIVKCLCERGRENNQNYESYRYVIWNYLINNSKKRINDETDNEKKLALQKEIYEQFDKNYNFNYFKLLNGIKKKEKEIEYIMDFVIQFIQNNEISEMVTNDLIFLSRNSFGALNKVFEFLSEKVPERLKDGEFISDSLSNIIFINNSDFVDKFCSFAFTGKTKEEISSILIESRIVTNLIDKMNLLNFVYEKGIVENRFASEDEENLASIVQPMKIIMKYEDKCQISSSERDQLKNAASLLIDKLKNLTVNIQYKNEVIDVLTKFIS